MINLEAADMKKIKMIETAIDNETWSELLETEQKCKELLKIAPSDVPENVVKKIDKFVDDLLEKNLIEDELDEYFLPLSILWGCMVVEKYKWRWQNLDFCDGNGDAIYIVSPKSYYCCPPFYFISNILRGSNIGPWGENDNTVMLLFNMLEKIEKKKPKSKFEVVV